MRYASAAAGTGRPGFVSTSRAMSARFASTSSTSTSSAPVRASTPAWVSSRVAPESDSMYSSRSRGYAGSSGRYAAPAFSTPSRATIASSERSSSTPTMSPMRTPRRSRWCASWFARTFSSLYVSRPASESSATASGVRAACASKSAWRHDAPATSVPGAFHAASIRRRSASVSSGSEDRRRAGSAQAASSRRAWCAAMRATVASSKRSELYSQKPIQPRAVSRM